jgi:preprotein translocase subunit SecD
MPTEAETGMPMPPNITKSFRKKAFEVFLGTNQLTSSSNKDFKNGGSSAYNIKAAPKLTFTADMFFDLSGSQAGEGTITLRLNQTDALKLGDLTETNVGRTLLITSQGKVIASPRITGRIDSQAIIFKIKDPTVLNGL